MALSLETQWTVVGCGVMAHADGVLDGEECDVLLSMVEGEANASEYSAWLSTISDRDRLEEMLTELPAPSEDAVRDILETAWTTAIVDGQRSPSEEEALNRIACRLGIESNQLDFWRDLWARQQIESAELLADAACFILSGEMSLDPAARSTVREFTRHVPTTGEHREELLAATVIPKHLSNIAHRMLAIPVRKRQWMIKKLATLPDEATDRAEAERRLLQLGEEAGVGEAVAKSLLEG